MKKEKELNKNIWDQEPPSLRSEVARAMRHTASRKATGPDEVSTKLYEAGGQTLYWTECTKYVRRSGKLVSGQRNGRSPRSSHFKRKVIVNSVQITEEQLLLSHTQARSFFGSYWKRAEWGPKKKLQPSASDSFPQFWRYINLFVCIAWNYMFVWYHVVHSKSTKILALLARFSSICWEIGLSNDWVVTGTPCTTGLKNCRTCDVAHASI